MAIPSLRIGVDVGGTNTDGVILDLSRSSEPDRGIIAWQKSSTTADPSDGINNVIRDMFAQTISNSGGEPVDPASVASVTIGTTHFINAVVEMDRSRLARVGVIRLCGPFSRDIPIGVDWPPALRDIICCHQEHVDGGLEIDGSLIAELDTEAVRRACSAIKAKEIRSIAIVGIYSPIDMVYKQEETAAAIVREMYPKANVVCSKDVANIGFLERENAAILNASILPLARQTIASFQSAVFRLGLRCPVFLTQNDGTILSASAAAQLPIRTFSSGPTNSMRGAAFLMQRQRQDQREAMMVVDIGGTTTDVGILLANGFPRQAAAYSQIAGVRTNFSYPDVRSIGLGGGSIVRRDDVSGAVTVGPDSVGYRIRDRARVFGGEVATATDYTVLADKTLTAIGDRGLVDGDSAMKDRLAAVQARIRNMLETIIDTMKTSPADIPVVLVGGGAMIAPESLRGASRVVKPPWSGVANAIGAATARVQGVVDSVESTEGKTQDAIMDKLSWRAIDAAAANGARRQTVAIAERESFPLQYIADKSRVIVKAVGDFDFERTDLAIGRVDVLTEESNNSVDNGISSGDAVNVRDYTEDSVAHKEASKNEKCQSHLTGSIHLTREFITSYRPSVSKRSWYLSEVDLEFLSTGCYILGTGGGGSPYQHFLRLREMLRDGAILRVISPHDLPDDAVVACGGGMGSPQVSTEKPYGDEMLESQRELYEFLGKKPTAVIPLEIGGGNGLQGLVIGASTKLDIPCVDGDWMGRAYPTSWQTTPVVFEEATAVMAPTCISDGNGRVLLMTHARSELDIERALRGALSQMGSHVGCAKGPVTGRQTKSWVIENTVSLAWRIGRVVALARCSNTIDSVAEAIVEEVGGEETARVLFKGKIVGVERVLRLGHAYGEVIIESTKALESDAKTNGEPLGRDRLVIPFKNENIYAKRVNTRTGDEILTVVPDLVCVIDAQNGEALGTQDYRYGLLVTVLGITASEKWTSTDKGLEIGGPKSFGFNDLEYKPLGKFSRPRSVIDEYDCPAA